MHTCVDTEIEVGISRGPPNTASGPKTAMASRALSLGSCPNRRRDVQMADGSDQSGSPDSLTRFLVGNQKTGELKSNDLRGLITSGGEAAVSAQRFIKRHRTCTDGIRGDWQIPFYRICPLIGTRRC